MSSAVCESRLPSAAFVLDGLGGGARCGDVASSAAASIDQWIAQQEAAIQKEAAEKKDGQLDIWAAIQSSKKASNGDTDRPAPYVHPLVRRSASSLNQKSLAICTESLGSETGSDGVLSSDEPEDNLPWPAAYEEFMTNSVPEKEGEQQHHKTEAAEHAEPLPPPPARRKELAAVNYHCSISRRSLPRAFPPPLPSLSRRDGPCLSMRSHRRDGRLVVEAVSVPSQNYLHAQRQEGRLLLTLVETTFQEVYPEREEPAAQHLHHQQRQAHADRTEAEEEDRRWSERTAADDDTVNDADDEEMEEEEEEEEEGEEEVEVVDRGIVVEVNVSRPPQPQSGGVKVQRSSVVINKFVGAAVEGELAAAATAPPRSAPANSSSSTTTTTTATAVVAAAAAASSSLSTDERYWRYGTGPQTAQRPPSPEKLFFTSKRQMNRQDLLHQVRRCSEHLRPLFIWEPCCIASS